jgi:hypothetical protein
MPTAKKSSSKTAKKTAAKAKRTGGGAGNSAPFKVFANFRKSRKKAAPTTGGPLAPLDGDGPHAMVIDRLIRRIVANKDKKGNIVLTIDTD